MFCCCNKDVWKWENKDRPTLTKKQITIVTHQFAVFEKDQNLNELGRLTFDALFLKYPEAATFFKSITTIHESQLDISKKYISENYYEKEERRNNVDKTVSLTPEDLMASVGFGAQINTVVTSLVHFAKIVENAYEMEKYSLKLNHFHHALYDFKAEYMQTFMENFDLNIRKMYSRRKYTRKKRKAIVMFLKLVCQRLTVGMGEGEEAPQLMGRRQSHRPEGSLAYVGDGSVVSKGETLLGKATSKSTVKSLGKASSKASIQHSQAAPSSAASGKSNKSSR